MRVAYFARAAMVLSIGVAVVALPACSGSNHSGEPTPALLPTVNSPIADVPVPAGYGMTGESTSKVQASGLRFVDHKYNGSDDLLPVVKFYRDEMPKNGWAFVDQNQLEHNQISLHFTKNNEDCIVTVTPGTFHSHIRVQIDPVGRNDAK